MILSSIVVVWFSMFFCKFISSFGTIPGVGGWGGGGGGWVGEHGNKANSAEAEAKALLGLAELGNNKKLYISLK